jgi:hypothetical protein
MCLIAAVTALLARPSKLPKSSVPDDTTSGTLRRSLNVMRLRLIVGISHVSMSSQRLAGNESL